MLVVGGGGGCVTMMVEVFFDIRKSVQNCRKLQHPSSYMSEFSFANNRGSLLSNGGLWLEKGFKGTLTRQV